MIGNNVNAEVISQQGEKTYVPAVVEGIISPKLFKAFYVTNQPEEYMNVYLEQLFSFFGEDVLNENWVYLSLEDGSYIYTPESKVVV